MTLNQMSYFSAVCRCRSISFAAKSLMISQPALSASIAELEEEVGVKLLARNAKGVRPTEEGERLLAHVEGVLSRYQLLLNDIPVIADLHNEIRLGFRAGSGESEMIRLSRDFRKENPNVKFVYNEMRNTTPHRYLDEEQFDFLGTTARLLPTDWREKYAHLQLGLLPPITLCCHEDNPLAEKEAIGFEDLAQQRLAMWEGHKGMGDRVRILFEERGRAPMEIIRMSQISGVAELICANVAVGILLGDMADHLKGIRRVRLKEELNPIILGGDRAPFYLLWRKDSERNELMKKFVQFSKKWKGFENNDCD
ncbi:MAG: LysR family transcriptional regulator [Clostridia bacterium]|nr:LysR family transcriptional regulator [Clostridia bacterium]